MFEKDKDIDDILYNFFDKIKFEKCEENIVIDIS